MPDFTSSLTTMCDPCKREMIELLEKRMVTILRLSHEHGDDEAPAIAESHCFHLLEIKHILEGKGTSGVYDDYGPPFDLRAET